MNNFLNDISKWSTSMKLGTAIALGGVVLLATSIHYATSQSTSTSINPSTSDTITIDPIVNEEIEEVIRPYTVNCEIAHYFYEETDPVEKKEKSIVTVPGSNRTYMLSEGCDYTYNDNSFNVIAVVSGTITDKISDATFGDILILTHESGTKFVYASLSNVTVNKGQEVKQGDVIGHAGTSLYTTSLGKSLHFEVMKNDLHLNPEKIYTKSVENL